MHFRKESRVTGSGDEWGSMAAGWWLCAARAAAVCVRALRLSVCARCGCLCARAAAVCVRALRLFVCARCARSASAQSALAWSGRCCARSCSAAGRLCAQRGAVPSAFRARRAADLMLLCAQSGRCCARTCSFCFVCARELCAQLLLLLSSAFCGAAGLQLRLLSVEPQAWGRCSTARSAERLLLLSVEPQA